MRQKTRKIDANELGSALALIALSLWICIGSLATLPFGSFHRPGPAFLPFWAGVLLGAMSLALFVKSFLPAQRSSLKFSFHALKKPVLALVILIVYAVAFRFLGLFACNFLFMIFMVLLMEKKHWYVAVGIGIITSFGFYCLFSLWLRVPLPHGILF